MKLETSSLWFQFLFLMPPIKGDALSETKILFQKNFAIKKCERLFWIGISITKKNDGWMLGELCLIFIH